MSSFIRNIRKSVSRLTGLHGIFSGKNMTPLNPANNLPNEVTTEDINDTYTYAIAQQQEDRIGKILTKQKSFDSAYPYASLVRHSLMDNYLASRLNYHGIYTQFYESLSQEEIDVILKYQKHSELFNDPANRAANIDSINLLNDIFKKSPRTQFSTNVYRCYRMRMSLNMIRQERQIDRFLSTTLSYKLSLGWCYQSQIECNRIKEDPHYLDDNSFVVISIIIPKGAQVLPLVYRYIGYHNEYEVLLPPGGKLVYTEICHPRHNIPVFIYFENADLALEYERSVNPDAFPTVQCVQNNQDNQCQVVQTQDKSLTSLFDTLLRAPDEGPDIEDYGDALSSAYGGKKRKSIKNKFSKKIKSKKNKKK